MIRLNSELTFDIPEGFRVLTADELQQYATPAGAPNWCASDPDRHMMFSVSWKKSLLAGLLLNTKEVVKKMEQNINRMMASYGYKQHGFVEEDLNGVTAYGFRYTYTSKDTAMAAQTIGLKKGSTFYYIHCYMREELLEESRPVLDGILRSVKWE